MPPTGFEQHCLSFRHSFTTTCSLPLSTMVPSDNPAKWLFLLHQSQLNMRCFELAQSSCKRAEFFGRLWQHAMSLPTAAMYNHRTFLTLIFSVHFP